jgi:large subunit ribosomal protein L30
MTEQTTQAKAAKKPAAGKPAGSKKPAAKAAAEKGGAKVRVTLLRSVIGTRESHRATVRGLGLKRRHQTVELEDTPAVRGMIHKVNYLLKVEG